MVVVGGSWRKKNKGAGAINKWREGRKDASRTW